MSVRVQYRGLFGECGAYEIGADSDSPETQVGISPAALVLHHIMAEPGVLKKEMQNTNDTVNLFLKEALASKVPTSFKDALKIFQSRWKTFYDNHSSYIKRSLPKTRNKLFKMQRELYEYYRKFQDMGGRTSVVIIDQTKRIRWKPLVIAGGALIVIGTGLYVVFRRGRRS